MAFLSDWFCLALHQAAVRVEYLYGLWNQTIHKPMETLPLKLLDKRTALLRFVTNLPIE